MHRLVYLMIVCIVVGACSSGSGESTDIDLAKVGDRILTLNDAITAIPVYILMADSAQAVQRYVDRWVRDQVMYDEAIRLGLHNATDIQKRLQKVQHEILIAELRYQIQRSNEEHTQINDSEVALFYEQNRGMFVLNERHVRVRHLIATSQQAAEQARLSLLNGLSWDEIAREYAVDVEYSISTNSELVPYSQALIGFGTLRSVFLVVGLSEVSPVTQESGYYHFIQIVEDRPAGYHPELNTVFPKIKEWIQLDKARRNIKNYEQNLYLQAQANGEIVIY
jgi:hypothetical protein